MPIFFVGILPACFASSSSVLLQKIQTEPFAWYQRKYRRLVVRWERQPRVFDGFLTLATIHIWINKILLVG